MTYVAKIVEAFGGVRSLARATGKPASTVMSWKRRGSIPDDQKRQVLDASDAANLGLKPADFFPGDTSGAEAAQ
jgi:hypothetical protein